jgi:elongation factor P--(R)-beta-lysine ligase
MDWRPNASIDDLKKRANFLVKIRAFFVERGYFEVQTPIMGKFGVTDRYLSNISAVFRGQNYALQTSPEYHMKRLLAAGSGPIFQLIQAFRDDELGRWHNPEFTMLEWYQLDADHLTLLKEVEELVCSILMCPSFLVKTYREIFLNYCDIDPWHVTLSELRESLDRYDLGSVLSENERDKDQYLFLLMSHVVEPALKTSSVPVAIIDFPITQASLAKTSGEVAERFEVYYQGVELANGFHELLDPAMQRARFQQDNAQRKANHLPEVPCDEYLLQALAAGLPPCSGVALGVDRLIALALGKSCLSDVMAFDHSRA